MRKIQEKTLQRAIATGQSAACIEVLSDERYPVKYYKDIYCVIRVGKNYGTTENDIAHFASTFMTKMENISAKKRDLIWRLLIWDFRTNYKLAKHILEWEDFSSAIFEYFSYMCFVRNEPLPKFYDSVILDLKKYENSIEEVLSLYANAVGKGYGKISGKEYDDFMEVKLYIDAFLNSERSDLTKHCMKYCWTNKISFKDAMDMSMDVKQIKTYVLSKNMGAFLQQYPFDTDVKPTVYVPEQYQTKIEHLKEMDFEITAKITTYKQWYHYSDSGLNLTFQTCGNVLVENGSSKSIGKLKQLDIFIPKDGNNIFCCKKIHGKEKWVPLDIKTLALYCEENDFFFHSFLDVIFEWCSQHGNLFVKDVIPYVKSGRFYPPLLIADVKNKYHTFEQAFAQKYLSVQNWNKHDVNMLYVLAKVAPYVTDVSRKTLLHCTNVEIVNSLYEKYSFSYRKNRRNGIFVFLKNYMKDWLKQNGQELSIENEYLVDDYINMSLITKTKVNLHLKSMKKIKVAHDAISEKYYMKQTPVVKIPKGSRFLSLRHKLPTSFEWIKTRKRLIHETAIQHHCVWSYAKMINDDNCAIYSFVYEPKNKRYTIEFNQKQDGSYYIQQMHGIYNENPSDEVFSYVKSFLN